MDAEEDGSSKRRAFQVMGMNRMKSEKEGLFRNKQERRREETRKKKMTKERKKRRGGGNKKANYHQPVYHENISDQVKRPGRSPGIREIYISLRSSVTVLRISTSLPRTRLSLVVESQIRPVRAPKGRWNEKEKQQSMVGMVMRGWFSMRSKSSRVSCPSDRIHVAAPD